MKSNVRLSMSTTKVSILLSTLQRRTLPAIAAFTAVMAAAFAYLSSTPRLYETTVRLMINDRQLSVSDLGRDLARLPEGSAGGANPLATQAELIKSQRVLGRAIAKIKVEDGKNAPTVSQLSQEMRVKIIPATSILELSYRDKDPKIAADSLNAVMAAIGEENVGNIRAGARSVREFLEAEVPKQRALLEQAEVAESRYRQTTGLVSVEDQTRALVQSLGATENQERDLAIQLQDATTQTLALKQLMGQESRQNAYISARVGQDEELRALRTKLNDLATQVFEVRSRLGDQHPDLLALIEQRDEVRQLYQAKLSRILSTVSATSGDFAGDPLSQELVSKLITSDIERAALEQKVGLVRNERIELQSRLVELPVKQRTLATLDRTRQEAESTLKQLQAKLQEARIAEAQLVSNIQVISVAEPPTEPQWPKKSSILVTAGAFGLILSAGVVLLLEFLDNAIYDLDEAEALFEQPCLGRLPYLPAALIHLKQPELFLDNSYLVEPYHKLLKTLEFRSGKQLHVLVVSSALANEGKSTVVSHLAAVSAMLSQRTLVIDADLQRSKRQPLFNPPLDSGLAEIIDGRMTLSEAIQPTNHQNLSVLTRGKRSQRPSLLLESVAMQSLLQEAAKTFDLVILDTPPISSCADALTLSRYSDGLLFVVRPGITTQGGLAQSIEELKRNGLSIMGFVANHVDIQSDRNDFDANDRRRFINFLQRLPLSRTLQQWSAIHLEASS